jgi:hypothetical protein
MADTEVTESPFESLRREWVASADISERALAHAAAEALLELCRGWIVPLAVEARIGCFDRQANYASEGIAPPRPHHLLHATPLPPGLALEHSYVDPEISSVRRIEREPLVTWIDRLLEQQCPDPARMEPTLLTLLLTVCQVKLPPVSVTGDSLVLGWSGNTVVVPLETADGALWAAGPRLMYPECPPISVAFTNDNGAWLLDIKLYWTLWRGELDRPGSDLYEAVQRMEQRGWNAL